MGKEEVMRPNWNIKQFCAPNSGVVSMNKETSLRNIVWLVTLAMSILAWSAILNWTYKVVLWIITS